jgi:hypothetical protein
MLSQNSSPEFVPYQIFGLQLLHETLTSPTFSLAKKMCAVCLDEEKTRNGILCTPSVNPPRKQRMSFRQRSVTYVKSFLRAFTREKRYPTCFKFRFVSSPQLPKYLHWYAKVSTSNWVAYSIIQIVSIIFGLSAALLAALAKQPFASHLSTRWQLAMVLLPLIGSLCSTFLIQFRIREFHALRENVRIEVEDVMQRARSAFASAKTDEEYKELYDSLISQIKLETKQSRGYFAIPAHSSK